MCTVTWTRPSSRGRTLLCNRDEQRSRPAALPPQIFELDGTRVVAPIDPQAGGTWLLANERGFVATLLNYYDATPPASQRPAEGYRSRGLLLRSLGACTSPSEAGPVLRHAVCEAAYAPFWIIALDPGGATTRWRWDGEDLTSSEVGPDVMPVTTSSWETADVLAERARLFEQLHPGDADELETYHHSCSSKGGPWGPCMARADARTVSFSRIDLSPEGIFFSYRPRATEDDAGFEPPATVTLPWHPDHRP